MTLGELNSLIQGAIEMHGPDAKADFLYEIKSGRTRIGTVTGYTVYGMGESWGPTVRFTLNHARGVREE